MGKEAAANSAVPPTELGQGITLMHDGTRRAATAADAITPTLRRVLDLLPTGAVLFDRAGRVRWTNAAAGDLVRGPDLAGCLADGIAGSRREDWTRRIRAALIQTRPQRFECSPSRAPEGNDRSLILAFSALGDPGEAPRLGLLLIQDDTPRLGLEQRLAVSERLAAVGKLCASITHELNNPLDGILRFLNLAIRRIEQGDLSPALEYLGSARDGAMRMVRVVRGLLEVSRRHDAEPHEGDVNRLLEDAVRALEPRATDCGVSVRFHLERRPLPRPTCGNLFQIFFNLLKNAVDAMPDGGALDITSRLNDETIEVRFEDTGPGLPAPAEQLFEPFFTTKPVGKGTGLGLAVCRELIEGCGGTITAADRTDRRGAVFSVRVPARREDRASADAAHAAPVRSGRRLAGGPRAQPRRRKKSRPAAAGPGD